MIWASRQPEFWGKKNCNRGAGPLDFMAVLPDKPPSCGLHLASGYFVITPLSGARCPRRFGETLFL